MTNRPSPEKFARQLETIPFFTGINKIDLTALAQNARWHEYETGEIVVLEGEASTGLYYLETGWLKAVKVSANGREQILRFLEPGDTFNEIAVFSQRPNPATAIALEEAAVWMIPRPVMQDFLRERPDFAQQVIAKMADRMLHLVSLVTDLSLRTVSQRLARLILDAAEGDRLERPRWYTQAELASRLGTVPDVVQRALRQMDKEGLIAVKRQLILIQDRSGLERMAE